MISSLKRQNIYEINIGAGEEYYEQTSGQVNDCDGAFRAMCLDIYLSMSYLIDYSNPKDLWTTLDTFLGKHNEDASINLES